MKDYYLTAERFEELKKELVVLKTVRRREVAERLQRAKELGDLSENAEYAEAREEQNTVESRIFELDDMIKNAVIIKHDGVQHGAMVAIGSTVIVMRGTKQSRFTIVGSNETRPAEGFISNESPLGKAFLGQKTGAVVVVGTPGGTV
jgi:transcription elongation factor GreA